MATSTGPFANCSKEHVESLFQCLWSFPATITAQSHGIPYHCQQFGCSFERTQQLAPYLNFYKRLSNRYGTDLPNGATVSHSDLHILVQTIRAHPELVRAELIKTQLADNTVCKTPMRPEDRDRAIDLAVRVMTMINCQPQNRSVGYVEYGATFHGWSADTTFSEFIESCFPTPMPPAPPNNDQFTSDEILVRTNLTASRVMKKAKYKFEATDDIRKHLVIDRQRRIVQIFHHAAFLKENLRCTRGQDPNATMIEQLKLCAIPRQIALEILDSIQKVLFRHSDAKSRAILRSLVSKENFDPECLHFEFSSLRIPGEEEVAYRYFGSRMAELYEEIENPSPDGLFEKWLERRSGARYVMLATLIGVLFAVLLGILSLVASIFQAYISYQAWKHPLAA